MKRLILVSIIAIIAISCSKENNGFVKDPNAKLSLRPAVGVTLKSDNPSHLSAYEIVKRTWEISFINKKVYDLPLARGFGESQRDYTNNRLLLFATDVINEDGSLKLDFIEGSDFILYEQYWVGGTDGYMKKDTIAYLQNSEVRAAEIAIKSAYSNKNYNECYRLMDDAFRFKPITGAEWRSLKAEDKN